MLVYGAEFFMGSSQTVTPTSIRVMRTPIALGQEEAMALAVTWLARDDLAGLWQQEDRISVQLRSLGSDMAHCCLCSEALTFFKLNFPCFQCSRQ